MTDSATWPQRTIVGFDRDEHGDHFALLECGHRRHMRHRPPLESRPWVLSAEGQQTFIGQPLPCRRCTETDETI